MLKTNKQKTKHLNHSFASGFRIDSTDLWKAAQNDYFSCISLSTLPFKAIYCISIQYEKKYMFI